MRLAKREVRNELSRVGGWRLRGKEISKTITFEDFAQAMRFVNRVAKRAESMNHHPDMLIQYNRVRLSLTTHDEGGLTKKDFKLARKINELKPN